MTVVARVAAARARQVERQGHANSRLESPSALRALRAEPAALALLGNAMQRLALSARAYHRVLRVARTIADLAACESICTEHVAEAVTLRQLDRRVPGASISA